MYVFVYKYACVYGMYVLVCMYWYVLYILVCIGMYVLVCIYVCMYVLYISIINVYTNHIDTSTILYRELRAFL